jgi:hypothetical protein
MKRFFTPILLSLSLIVGAMPSSNASAQATKFQIGKDRNPEIYIELTFENLDAPNQPISVGHRFKMKAICVVNISAVLGRDIRTFDFNQILTQQNISTDPNAWWGGCNLLIGQKENKQFEFNAASSTEQVSIPVSWQSPTVIPFFEEIARAESTDEIFVTATSHLWSTDIKYTKKNGSQGKDSIEFDNSYYEYPLFSPLAKSKTNSTPRIVELDGEEESEEEPIFQIKKESSSAYLVTLLNYRANFEARIRATKKGNKTYTFVAKTDSDGDLSIRAKRNLKGYKLDLLENGKSIVSKVISS